MAVDLICPDCGGVIGGTSNDSEGRGPCTCYKGEGIEEREDSGDTVSLPSQPHEPAAVPVPKLCVVCGKNVAGHRRVKDSRGYLCWDCSKAEVKQEKEGTVACTECGRRLKEAGLVLYKGKRICKKCNDYHQEMDFKNRKVATKEIDEYEKRNVIILGVIFGILAIIVTWQTLKHLF